MTTRMYYDGPLTVVESDWLDDWWLIEKVEHDHEKGLRPFDGGRALCLYDSSRVSDADVEGTAEEFRALAQAIQRGEAASFRRCAVRPDGEHYFLWSPRNSMAPGMVPVARAAELAELILDTVPEAT